MTGLNWTFEQLADLLQRVRVWHCGHSVVLRISSTIVAKVALEAGDERLHHEQTILAALTDVNCPSFARCHLRAADVCFLQLVAHGTLHDRISIARPRPILRWMLQLSHAAACLEALGYCHGDINPQNILLDDSDEVKLVDFDHALRVGDNLDVGYEPYVRLHRELAGGLYGVAGPVTEQIALGSLFWYMARGKELYAELEGPEQVDRLLDGIFPTTNPQDPVDRIIRNCWDGHYRRVADLVEDIQVVSGLALQTRDDETASQRREQTLRCEEFYNAANLTPTSS